MPVNIIRTVIKRPPAEMGVTSPNPTVVMVTTETEIPQVMRALGAGADEYLMKPFTKAAVLDKLHLLGFEV